MKVNRFLCNIWMLEMNVFSENDFDQASFSGLVCDFDRGPGVPFSEIGWGVSTVKELFQGDA